MRLLLRWLLSAAALMLIAQYVPGIRIFNFYSALIAALVLGFVNALIKPIIVFFTLPFNILTLGLFTLVINAALFWFSSTVVKGFYVHGFWPAFWGALLLWVVNWFLSSLLRN